VQILVIGLDGALGVADALEGAPEVVEQDRLRIDPVRFAQKLR